MIRSERDGRDALALAFVRAVAPRRPNFLGLDKRLPWQADLDTLSQSVFLPHPVSPSMHYDPSRRPMAGASRMTRSASGRPGLGARHR